MYSLNYNSLAHVKNVSISSMMSGSSKYRLVGSDLELKQRYRSHSEIEGNVHDRYMSAVKSCEAWRLPMDINILRSGDENMQYVANNIDVYRKLARGLHHPEKKRRSTYKLNKTKVRNKLTALCRLEASKRFIAFYSVSFPAGCSDKIIYKMFNKWLTNCRKRYNLKTYAWVAERQSNNTLHFHILTPNWMDVKKVNKAMAVTINNEVLKGNATWNNSSVDKYNGVDVDSPQFPKKRQNENRDQYRKRKSDAVKGDVRLRMKWIASYLVKYVTKSKEEFIHLPYHSSRDVSALFTSQMRNDDDAATLLNYLSDDIEDYDIYEKDIVSVYFPKIGFSDNLFKHIDSVNEIVYNKVNESPPE